MQRCNHRHTISPPPKFLTSSVAKYFSFFIAPEVMQHGKQRNIYFAFPCLQTSSSYSLIVTFFSQTLCSLIALVDARVLGRSLDHEQFSQSCKFIFIVCSEKCALIKSQFELKFITANTGELIIAVEWLTNREVINPLIRNTTDAV